MQRCFERPRGGWHGWEVTRLDHWTLHRAPGAESVDQGWKLHFSAIVEDADVVLERVAHLCRSRSWTFKHLVDVEMLERANGKDADRAGSGKFITVYPAQSTVDERLLDSLARDLDVCRGPRILSDLQWRGSVVHVRWGAFRLWETWDGSPAVRRPDGSLEPDRRGVLFELPAWVPAPAWIDAGRARGTQDAGGRLASLAVEGAYSFSNSGGVYRARDADLGAVVLKEGREHVARIDGFDSADRVEREHGILRRLSGSGVAPEPHDSFRESGSAFLLTEPIDGVPFNRAVMSKCPLTRAEPDPGTLAAHASVVERVIDRVTSALDAVHRRGVVHGDLAPRNVLVRPDGSVALIDFESAVTAPSSARDGSLATPGFAAPRALTGTERDRFSLACLHLAALIPLTALFPLDPTFAGRLIDEAQRRYPTARLDHVRTVLESALGEPLGSPLTTPASAPHLVRALARRAWEPGAAAGAQPRATGLEHGADGVRFVLGDLWPSRAIEPGARKTPGVAGGPGLFSGLAGAVLASSTPADRAGIAAATAETERVDFQDGLAGIGVALLLGGEGTELESPIDSIAARLIRFSHDQHRAERLRPGLLTGPSGIALFLAMYGRRRDDRAAVDAAQRLLRIDLERLRETAEGGFQIAVGNRLLPFLGAGSAGVGIAAVQLRLATGDSALDDVLVGILRASCPLFTVHAGLLDGRAGLVHFAVDVAGADLAGVDRSLVVEQFGRHRAAFALHQLVAGEPIFPDKTLRGYDDSFGHGTAGVLSALEAMDDHEAGIPRDLQRPSFLRQCSR